MYEQQPNEPMLDMYIFETTQNIEQIEVCILESEKTKSFTQESINEIFRIMHTIKGSSAMMQYNNISSLAHIMEDLFYYIREQKPCHLDYSTLSNLILDGMDFIKVELYKIKVGDTLDGDASELIKSFKEYLSFIKTNNSSELEIDNTQQNTNYFKATIFFEDGCEMENIRAYAIIHNIKEITNEVYYLPAELIDSDASILLIREDGFKIYIKTDKSHMEMSDFFNRIIFLKHLELIQLDNDDEFIQFIKPGQLVTEDNLIKVTEPRLFESQLHEQASQKVNDTFSHSVVQSIISVNVSKLDALMNLVGEMVITEAMVIQNPDLMGLQLDNFQKAARQLHKITSELQDIVMSIRMVSLYNTFHKMHRVVRDMCKKLDKEVQLELVGEETEVDKNIIDHISDPLMHLVRNAIDHGIESVSEREAAGKSQSGRIIIEAKSVGNDVIISVSDDGKGLNKETILNRARENNLLWKPESEMTSNEIYNLILMPGFSTKEDVTEFSGRGVGMDVVVKNIESVGGVVSIESVEGKGSSFILKIPLTLAIIDGMNILVGNSRYTIPTTAIKECFRPKQTDLIIDPDGNEMIMVRGQCYSILRLHKFFNVKTDINDITDGIIIMVEQNDKRLCIFADNLLGQQQVVVKILPSYIRNTGKKQSLAGCTLLGDGSISLILDISGLINGTIKEKRL